MSFHPWSGRGASRFAGKNTWIYSLHAAFDIARLYMTLHRFKMPRPFFSRDFDAAFWPKCRVRGISPKQDAAFSTKGRGKFAVTFSTRHLNAAKKNTRHF